ncbi:MAG TPA: trypsin-like peptidase domain-containing protein [Gemmataceae bacterium]|nr:trypsin-like peptidase domain-containing protein [Gemmataceae bacterium]
MRTPRILLLTAGLLAALAAHRLAPAQELDPRILEVEQKRIAVVEKVKPAVVAIFARGGQGGGSGVLISDDGYALTNFHVVAPAGPTMKCGLPDGVMYDAVLVGLDKVGDVALIKLLPKKEGDKFPFARMGDSDKVKAGDWSLAMGNPFLLATDFTPTVTFGLVSGTNRYQYPEGRGLLEYTDCIQIDTSINPGNSGGPLFNLDGELIGINGRGSFDKRGRVNSGVGYAISINQIKNFMGHLRAGLDADHASLGARIEERSEDEMGGAMVVTSILEESDAYRRGLRLGDELVSFAGRPMANANHFKNVLGLYPKGWRVPLVFRRENENRESEKREILVRLMGVQRQELGAPTQPPGPRPRPPAKPAEKPKEPESPAAKLYEAKAGFANYYFNKLERDRLLAAFRKHGDFTPLAGDWTIEADGEVKKERASLQFTVKQSQDGDKDRHIVLDFKVGGVGFQLEPLRRQNIDVLRQPRGSGGLPIALYHYWQLLTIGPKGFEGDFSHGGHEPFYPPAADMQADFSKRRVDCEVLRTEHVGVTGKWYFSLKDQMLLGFEIQIDREDDPCEVYLSDYKPVDGRMLPHQIEVRHGNDRYGVFTVKSYTFGNK